MYQGILLKKKINLDTAFCLREFHVNHSFQTCLQMLHGSWLKRKFALLLTFFTCFYHLSSNLILLFYYIYLQEVINIIRFFMSPNNNACLSPSILFSLTFMSCSQLVCYR